MTPLSSPSVTAIICAAGKGERAGMNGNKLFAPLYGGVSASAKNETKREKTAENGRMERMSGQCERADETNKRATRTEGKDGSADTTERNFRTEATDDVNGRNEQTGNADERAQTDKPIRADGRTERTDGRNERTDGRTDRCASAPLPTETIFSGQTPPSNNERPEEKTVKCGLSSCLVPFLRSYLILSS